MTFPLILPRSTPVHRCRPFMGKNILQNLPEKHGLRVRYLRKIAAAQSMTDRLGEFGLTVVVTKKSVWRPDIQ